MFKYFFRFCLLLRCRALLVYTNNAFAVLTKEKNMGKSRQSNEILFVCSFFVQKQEQCQQF